MDEFATTGRCHTCTVPLAMFDMSGFNSHGYDLLQTAVSAILSNPSQLAVWLQKLIQRLLGLNVQEGMYEVLEYEARLELRDTTGKHAVFFKRQKVRFLQDNIIAFQDQAYGDGDIFADYKCSPGVPVDRYQEGYRYRILISLRQTKDRGDVEEFRIERHIKDGFAKADGYFQTNVDHQTDKLSLSVVFPSERMPFEVLLVEEDEGRTTPLSGEQTQRLPNGSWLVQWSTDKPKRFESYILRWKW